MPLLDALIYGLRDVFDQFGVQFPRRSRILFNSTVTDDPVNDRLIVGVGGGGGGGVGPTITNTASGTINDVATDSSGTPASLVRFTGGPSITGLQGGTTSRLIEIRAVGVPLTIVDNSGGSAATNKIRTGVGANVVVPANGAAVLVYDISSGIWSLAYSAPLTPGVPAKSLQTSDVTGSVLVALESFTREAAGRLNVDLTAATPAYCTIGAPGGTFPASGFFRGGDANGFGGGFYDFFRAQFTTLGFETQLIRVANTYWNLGSNGLDLEIDGGPINFTCTFGANQRISFTVGTAINFFVPAITENAGTKKRATTGLGDVNIESDAPSGTTTTNATQTVIATGTMDLGCNEFTVKVLATDLANTHSAVYNLAARGHWTGSTGTINDITNGFNSVDANLVTGGLTSGPGQTTVTLTTSGATWSLKVTGGGSLTLHWSCVVTRVNNV